METRTLRERADQIFVEHRRRVLVQTDQLFAILMVVQWVFGIIISLTLSPYTWEGRSSSVHVHVYAAVFLGALLSAFPVALARRHPGETITRHVIAASQMLWSALLIHLSGGRIETHFHVFGSLAFIAFYRDWRVLVTATVVVAADHFLRGLFWPDSVYGIAQVQWWRFLEHAGWVVFEDVVLVMACLRATEEMRSISDRQAEVEALSSSEQEKSRALDRALTELRASQEQMLRAEKLAAVGQLAASVGHELRNPLAAIRNSFTFISKKLGDGADAKVVQFLGIADRELGACNRIITDLLDFARDRSPTRRPCPLRPLVDEAAGLVPARANVTVKNEVSETLPIPSLDKDQFRQVLVNLTQNAVEAIPDGRTGTIVIGAMGGGAAPLRITVKDDGPGIPADAVEKIFQPLFTTKTKGTGLGLAIVASIVQRHGATINVDTAVGSGTTFTIELPPEPAPAPQLAGSVA